MGELHKSIQDEWLLWRIVEEKGWDPDTIRFKWSRADVLKFNAILNMRESSKICDLGYEKYQKVRSRGDGS